MLIRYAVRVLQWMVERASYENAGARRGHVQIAAIGWGSLVWCPGCLQIKSKWHPDGPLLPIEFGRISDDERLTLVVHHDSPEQRTYWALSGSDCLANARLNLQAREGARLDDIHLVAADGRTEGRIDREVADRIQEWLSGRRDVQAAVWTGLVSNWPNKRGGKEFSYKDAIAYLRELMGDKEKVVYKRAREYVCNAPPQIQTPLRKLIREQLAWEDAALPEILFEQMERAR